MQSHKITGLVWGLGTWLRGEPVGAGLVAGLDDLTGFSLNGSTINCPWLEVKETLDKEHLGTHPTDQSHGNHEMLSVFTVGTT